MSSSQHSTPPLTPAPSICGSQTSAPRRTSRSASRRSCSWSGLTTSSPTRAPDRQGTDTAQGESTASCSRRWSNRVRDSASVAEALATLRDIRRELLESGARIIGAGLHPNASAGEATCIRPAVLDDRGPLQGVLRTPICGQHIHVGMPDQETAVRAYNGIRTHVPLINALASNSPFWFGVDSGLASARTVLFRSYPGPPWRRSSPTSSISAESLRRSAWPAAWTTTATSGGTPGSTPGSGRSRFEPRTPNSTCAAWPPSPHSSIAWSGSNPNVTSRHPVTRGARRIELPGDPPRPGCAALDRAGGVVPRRDLGRALPRGGDGTAPASSAARPSCATSRRCSTRDRAPTSSCRSTPSAGWTGYWPGSSSRRRDSDAVVCAANARVPRNGGMDPNKGTDPKRRRGCPRQRPQGLTRNGLRSARAQRQAHEFQRLGSEELSP